MGFDDVTLTIRRPFGLAVASRQLVDVVALASGHESRNARTAHPLRRFTIPIGQRPMNEIRAVLSFFEARGGPLRAFRFRDPVEHTTNPNGPPTAVDASIGQGDGILTAFRLATPTGRPVTKPNPASVLISIDDVALDSGDFGVDALTGIVTLDDPPPPGASIKAGCVFDLAVRFENSTLTVNQSTPETGEMDDLVLLEVRA